jgi:nucleoside-diphosphate kinase
MSRAFHTVVVFLYKERIKQGGVQVERTLVLIKPDGVARGIIGEILHRFERAGLKMIGLKLIWPGEELADSHYPNDDDYKKSIGDKALASCKEKGVDPVKELGSDDAIEIGQMVRDTLIRSLTWGPIVAIALEGNEVITQVRTMVGSTSPSLAAPGTIRGDFSTDSYKLANVKRRALRNIVHASATPEESDHEVGLWFSADELVAYKRTDEDVMFEHI